MCGLVGFVGKPDRATLVAMTTRLAHRGPDGAGYYEHEDGVNLGHRRLSVLDIAGGDQPMRNDDGSVVVIYNGEIYNHLELRRELTALGYRFRSDHSDTEVLVHGYHAWGKDLLPRLNGMFALAIHDVRRRSVFLARDRFGEKPLFVFDDGRDFAFASELSAFLDRPGFKAEIDLRSVQKLFAYGYLPQPNAIYRNCRKLPAGSWMELHLVSRKITSGQYWRFQLRPDESLGGRGEDALVEELRELLLKAVERRLISDVPLGLFLSGGVDSSAILAMMAKVRDPATIKSFCIGFDEKSYDESAYAKEVAAHFGANHASRTLSLLDARSLMQPVLDRMDEPLGDASLLPTYLVAGFAREHVTVALSGDGGDELFAGYDPFDALQPAATYSSLVPGPLHRAARSLVGLLPKSTSNMSLDFKLRRLLTGLSYPESMWLPAWMSAIEPAEMGDLFDRPLPAEELYSESVEAWNDASARGLDRVDRALEFFTRIYLTDDILVKTDRAAMMHSLETRAVFLDNDLVDFAERLPNRFKYRRGARKYLLKKALRGILPDSIIDRKKKGFGIPAADWLKHTPAVVPMNPIAGVRDAAVAAFWQAHRAGRRDHRFFLWNWLALQSVAGVRTASA